MTRIVQFWSFDPIRHQPLLASLPKITAADGSSTYDRHKIFLYKEDFTKFADGLGEVVEFIRRSKGISEPEK